MEKIGMKRKYSFTIDENLMQWFKLYVREESTTMSGILNQYILKLKREQQNTPDPKRVLYSSN